MLTEEKIRQNFAARLDLACKQKGLPEKGRGVQIANIVKVTTKAVSKWFNAETMPSTSNIYTLAHFLGVTPEWLTYGDKNVVPNSIENTFSYPLISAVQAGVFTEIFDLEDSEGYKEVGSEKETVGEGFFLRISGMSMEPKFSEGDLVLVDTGLKPHPGDYVVAVNGTGEATLKRYRELGELSVSGAPHFELVQLNSDYPTLSSKHQDIRIIGVAIEHRSYL